MSSETTRILAKAASTPLCDCIVVGIRPDGEIYIDWSGSTIASAHLYLAVGMREVMKAWDEGVKLKDEAA